MGTIISKKSDKELTDLFLKLTGKDSIEASDSEFWNSLLSFSVQTVKDKNEDSQIFEHVKPLCISLCTNNLKTKNFGTLLEIFVQHVASCVNESHDIDRTEIYQQIQSILFIIRVFLQYLIQKVPEHDVIKQFDIKGLPQNVKSDDALSMTALTCNSIIDVLIKFPLSDNTYNIHSEAVNILLIFLSCHLFTSLNPSELEVYRIVYDNKNAPILCKVLLQRFIDQPPVPKDSRGSILIGLASNLIGLFVSHNQDPSIFAIKSLLLCVVLINHSSGKENGYKDCLFSLSDDFDALYTSICSQLDREETTLLLYHLVHKNHNFRTYLMNRSDIDLMILPILQTIYKASSESCPHMYLSLIILLILTNDYNFNKRVHTVPLKSTPWYTERNLSEVTLGGLIILVTTRAIQYNLLKMRDEYIHTNCLAALANMSSQFVHLHPYVCQRLVGLFEILAKTYNMAGEELVTIERALRIILEVINSCLSNQLIYNPNLVYSLLYKKDVFEAFKGHPVFQDIIQNINHVLEHFIAVIEKDSESLNVETVLNIIEKYSSQLPSHRLQKFPELKFKYVEEENPDEFFIPYIWSLIGKYSCVQWLPPIINQ